MSRAPRPLPQPSRMNNFRNIDRLYKSRWFCAQNYRDCRSSKRAPLHSIDRTAYPSYNAWRERLRDKCMAVAIVLIGHHNQSYDTSFPVYPRPLTVCYLGLDSAQAAATLPLSTRIVLSSCFSVSPNSTLFHVTIRASFISNSNTLTRL